MNAIAQVQAASLNSRQIELARRTVAADCNSDEFNLFIEACRHYRLDPLRKQIMALVFNKANPTKRRMVVVVAIDGQRIIAQRCGNYRPAAAPTVFEVDAAQKSETNPAGLVSARVTLFQQDNRGEWFPVVGEAFWDEFAPLKDEWRDDPQTGRGTKTGRKILDDSGNWAKMPRKMLEKVATMQALRAGWPDQFGGLYAEEELDRAKVVDLDASEIVEHAAEERRLAAIAHQDAIAITWGDVWGIEYVPLGSLADRVAEWLQQPRRTGDEVSAFRSANRTGLQEFWARAPSDALALKKLLEAAERAPAEAA